MSSFSRWSYAIVWEIKMLKEHVLARETGEKTTRSLQV